MRSLRWKTEKKSWKLCHLLAMWVWALSSASSFLKWPFIIIIIIPIIMIVHYNTVIVQYSIIIIPTCSVNVGVKRDICVSWLRTALGTE